MKREREEEEPFRILENDPLTGPLISRWQDKTKTTFPLGELPIDLLVKIIYEHLSEFLAIFQLNTRLRAIESRAGFWSGLFKQAYPEYALMLHAFIEESPRLGELDMDTFADLTVITAAFHSKREANVIRFLVESYEFHEELYKIEAQILQGDVSPLQQYYTYPEKYEGNRHMVFHLDNGLGVLNHTTFLDFYRIIKAAQLPLPWQKQLDKILESVGQFSTSNDYRLEPLQMPRFLDYWIIELEKEKLPRFAPFAQQLRDLKLVYEEKSPIVSRDDPNTGTLPTANALYFPSLTERFKAYFALTEEEANLRWKKFYLDVQRYVKPQPLLFGAQCVECASNHSLQHDKKLDILFCGLHCQTSFYNRYKD